jgi:hypothetical protein
MNSILEILRYVFPLIVADNIFYYLIFIQKQTLNNEFVNKLENINIHGILNIKKCLPAFWLINFEKTYIKNNLEISNNIDKFKIQRTQILIDNHLFIKKWRKRQQTRLKLIH